MYPAEIVVREVQGASGLVVVQLLRERIRQPRKAPDCHANREVLPLDIAGGDVAGVGRPSRILTSCGALSDRSCVP